MTKVIKKWFLAILACFTVFLAGEFFSLKTDNIEKASAASSEVSIGISRVYFLTGQDPSPEQNRPAQQIYDIVFDYDFPERGSWATVSGVLINGVDVAKKYNHDTGLSLAKEAAWADSSCSEKNTFRMYICGQESMQQLTFTEEFKFEINGVTYKLDREYDFAAWATRAYYGAWDGLNGPMRLNENVPVQENIPEIKVTGVEVRGYRDSELYVDVTFDKDLQKSESSFFMDNLRVNGQSPYIGSVNIPNTRALVYAQYAEETANRVRLFLNAKAADYGYNYEKFDYSQEIDTISILAGFKVVLADGTVAQVKKDYNYIAKQTVTRQNIGSVEEKLTEKPLYDLYIAQTDAELVSALENIETAYGYSMEAYKLLTDKTSINEDIKNQYFLTAEDFKVRYDKALEEILKALVADVSLPDVVKTNLNLPNNLGGIPVVWHSSHESVIDSKGNVNRPKLGNLDKTAVLTIDIAGLKLEFILLVPALQVERIEAEKTDFGNVEQNGYIDFIESYFTAYYDDGTSEQIEITPNLVSYQTDQVGKCIGKLSYEGASLDFTYTVVMSQIKVDIPEPSTASCASMINWGKGGIVYAMMILVGVGILLCKKQKS